MPTWLSTGVAGLFALHFLVVVIASLGGNYLPAKYWYALAPYVDPLFYQNYKVFAPDPPTQSRAVVFRFHTQDGWSPWQWPGFEHLYEMQANRLSVHSELFDMSEGMADNLYLTMQKERFSMEKSSESFKDYPAVQLCYEQARKFASLNSPLSDTLQFGLFIEHNGIADDELISEYSFFPFPKMSQP